jgi:hypothetical protein
VKELVRRVSVRERFADARLLSLRIKEWAVNQGIKQPIAAEKNTDMISPLEYFPTDMDPSSINLLNFFIDFNPRKLIWASDLQNYKKFVLF